MAFERIKSDGAFPAIAASNIGYKAAVGWSASGPERAVIPLATCNAEPAGISGASAGPAASSTASTVLTSAVPLIDIGNTVKVTAAGSLGVGADIGVASTNGGLAPVAGIAGSVIYRVGKAVGPAAAGEVFSLYVSPRQLSGSP